MDHYAVFNCYRYLQQSNNEDVLLVQLLKEVHESKLGARSSADLSDAAQTADVLDVIFTYHRHKSARAAHAEL